MGKADSSGRSQQAGSPHARMRMRMQRRDAVKRQAPQCDSRRRWSFQRVHTTYRTALVRDCIYVFERDLALLNVFEEDGHGRVYEKSSGS